MLDQPETSILEQNLRFVKVKSDTFSNCKMKKKVISLLF
jgi:hypothetical protein